VEITRDQVLVRMLRAGITGAPRQGDVITVGEGAAAETLTVDERVRSDESLWVLVCHP
jgi:hypothetical protein